jgi:amino acid adenylation domain-containing protein
MTYAELEARSNRLAHALRARGIGKGDFVALLSGRSIEAIEMILGVVKTGAAYVPLDPAYPPARQAYVLEDCGARLLLLGPAAQEAEAFAELRERGLEYEALSAEAAGLSGEPLDHVVHGDDPIYVMYTSGSTGKPKGVVVPHRGVVRLVVDQDYVELGPDETLMLLTALGFDLCQFEIWGALLFGGKLAIVPQTKPSLDDISQVIVEEGVTTALLAAALFHLICEERMAALAPLRQLVIGADVVSRTLVRRAQEALPHLRFVNGYGPTENSGLTTCYVFPPDGWGPGSSPIGQPIARSTAYIMDRRGRLSPQGAIGELWSGGEGVAIGYLGKPELTDEKFVPHPDDPAQRLYRTGDYARWRNDGAIEFFGRIDGQLKINGMRVELDEIEAVLCEVEGVGEAAVTVRSVPSGGKTVHAFVTTTRGREFDSAALDHHVAERLPRHMQPATVELIDKLPLNANGKVDRAALLKLIGSTQGAPHGAPQLVELNALEATVGAIWEEVLGVEKVRHDDALFDLGADSLQIFRISARMADKGYRLDNRKLLANPTLSEVCEMLTAVLQKNEPAKEAAKIAPLSAYRRTAMRETA